jgi:hypothetical protein
MNHWLRLGVPIVCGIVASGIYYRAVTSAIEPDTFVVVNRRVEAGDVIRASDLRSVSWQDSSGTFQYTGFPWEQRYQVIGLQTARRLPKGSPVFRRDVVAGHRRPDIRPGEKPLTLSLRSIAYEPAHLALGSEVSFFLSDSSPALRSKKSARTALSGWAVRRSWAKRKAVRSGK